MTTITLALALAALILAAYERHLRLQAERIAEQALNDLEAAEQERKQAYARGHDDATNEVNIRRDFEQRREVEAAETRGFNRAVHVEERYSLAA